MAFPVALLPVLAVEIDPHVVATGRRDTVELALSRGVHERLEQGFSLLAVETVNQQITLTLGKRDVYERHVLVLGSPDRYRVEPGTAPVDAEEPGDLLIAALSAPRGGLVVEAECGEYFTRGYLVEDEASGVFAQALVARTLATADDLEFTNRFPNRIRFAIDRGGKQRELEVWLDPKGTVIEAQVRTSDRSANHRAYPRLFELKAAMRKTRVIAIHGSLLVTSVGKLVIDDVSDGDDGEGGCGC